MKGSRVQKSIVSGEKVEEYVVETRLIDTIVKRVTDEMILRYKCDRERTSLLGRGGGRAAKLEETSEGLIAGADPQELAESGFLLGTRSGPF